MDIHKLLLIIFVIIISFFLTCFIYWTIKQYKRVRNLKENELLLIQNTAQRKAEEQARAAAQRKAEEQARAAAQRKAEEQARAAAQREAEEQARAAAQRKAEEQARAAAQRKAEEQARAAQREAEEQARAAAQRKAEEQARAAAQREAEEQARAAAQRKAEEQARAAQRKAEEQARAAQREAEERAKNKQENQFKFCENGTTYCANLISTYNQNPSDFNFETIKGLSKSHGDDVWKQLKNGVKQLDSYEQLSQYIFSYGRMHQAKLQEAYHSIFSNNHLILKGQQFEIIDYGCGQGIGTVCFLTI